MPPYPAIRFGPFELQLETGELLKQGRKIKLPPQSFRLLALLASRPGQLQTRDAIQKELWGSETFVDFEHGLNFCVRQIRRALGEEARRPRFIETLPRRGYRFLPELSNHKNGRRAALDSAEDAFATQLLKVEANVPLVAVLEFKNLSADNAVAWVATGMAETLATDLRRLRSIRVVSSDRVRVVLQQTGRPNHALSSADYGLLAKQMGANWIVAGSYQAEGGRVRVICCLYETGSDEMACAIKVDGTWADIFKLQDRIVHKLVAALRLTVNAQEKRRMAALETGHVEAYEEYSKGRHKFLGMGKGTLDEARVHFARALQLDASYAMAHSGLGATHAMRFVHRSDPSDLFLAKNHLEKACQLDKELAEPYPWLCYIYMREGRLQQALAAGQRAIQLLPDFVQAHYFLALVYFVSCETDPRNYPAAANHLLRAGQVKPQWQATWFVLSSLALLNGDYIRAEIFARRLREMSSRGPGQPAFVGAEALLGTTALRQGDWEQARHWFMESLKLLSQTDHMYRDGLMAFSACGLGDTQLRAGKADLALAAYRQAWQIVQEYPTMVGQDRHSLRALAGLAAAYAAQGERGHSWELLSEISQKLENAGRPQSGAAGANLADLYYAISAAYVRAQNLPDALTALEKAVHAGWLDASWLERDPEMQALHGCPQFSELLRQIRQFPKLNLEASAGS